MPTNIVNVLVRLTAIDTGVASRMSNITHSVRSVEGTLNRADGASRRFAGSLNQGLGEGVTRAQRLQEAFRGTAAALFASMTTMGLAGMGIMGAALQTAMNTQKEWSMITAAMGYPATKVDEVREHYSKALLDLVSKTGFSIGQIRDMWGQFKMLMKSVTFKEFTDSWAELIAGISIMQFIPGTAAANKLALALSGAPMGLRRLIPDIEKYVSFDAWRRMTVEQRKEVLKNVLTIKGYGEVARGYARTMEGQINILNSTFRTFLANMGMLIIKALMPAVEMLNKFGEWFRRLPKDTKEFIATVFIGVTALMLLGGALGFVAMGLQEFIEFLLVIPGINRVVRGTMDFLSAMFSTQAAAATRAAEAEEAHAAASNAAAAAEGNLARATQATNAAMAGRAAVAAEAAAATEAAAARANVVAATQALEGMGALSGATPATAATYGPAVTRAGFAAMTPGSAMTAAAVIEARMAAEAAETASEGFFTRFMNRLRGFGGRVASTIRNLVMAPVNIIRDIPNLLRAGASAFVRAGTMILGALFTPLGMIIALTAAFVILVSVTGKWGDVIKGIGEFLSGVYHAIADPIRDALTPLESMKDSSEGLRDALNNIYATLKGIAAFIGSGIITGLKIVFGTIGYYLSLLVQAVDKIFSGRAGIQDWVLAITNPLSFLIWLLSRGELLMTTIKKRWEAFIRTPEGKKLMADLAAALQELSKAWDEFVSALTGKPTDDRRKREASTIAAVMAIAASWVNMMAWTLQNIVLPVIKAIAWVVKGLKPVVEGIRWVFNGIAWVVARIVDLMEVIWTFLTKGPVDAAAVATKKLVNGLGIGSKFMKAMTASSESFKRNIASAVKVNDRLSVKRSPDWMRSIYSTMGPQIGRVLEGRGTYEGLIRARRLEAVIRHYEAERMRLLGMREAAIRRGDFGAAKRYEAGAKRIYNQERKIILHQGAIQVNAQGMSPKQVENTMYNVLRRLGGGA